MFVKIVSKINHDGNHYYVTVVSPESKIQQIATSDHPLIEGMTYRANPKMHWVSYRDYEPELAHFRIYGRQIPMEQTA